MFRQSLPEAGTEERRQTFRVGQFTDREQVAGLLKHGQVIERARSWSAGLPSTA